MTHSPNQIIRLIESYLPVDTLTTLGEGWDSTTYLVNNTTVFRFPKRPSIGHQMQHEHRILQLVGPNVSVTVPQFTYIGPAHAESSASFVGYPLVKGEPVCSKLPSTDDMKNTIHSGIGRFLTQLHAIPCEKVMQVGIEWFRWTGVSHEVSATGWEAGLRNFAEQIVTRVIPLLPTEIQAHVQCYISHFLQERSHFHFKPVLLHGDLSDEHILIDEQTGRVQGIIDFGDSGLGDPAYDVAPEITPFYSGQMDVTFSTRQQFYRSLAPFHTVLFGLEIGDENMVFAGIKEIASRK